MSPNLLFVLFFGQKMFKKGAQQFEGNLNLQEFRPQIAPALFPLGTFHIQVLHDGCRPGAAFGRGTSTGLVGRAADDCESNSDGSGPLRCDLAASC